MSLYPSQSGNKSLLPVSTVGPRWDMADSIDPREPLVWPHSEVTSTRDQRWKVRTGWALHCQPSSNTFHPLLLSRPLSLFMTQGIVCVTGYTTQLHVTCQHNHSKCCYTARISHERSSSWCNCKGNNGDRLQKGLTMTGSTSAVLLMLVSLRQV